MIEWRTIPGFDDYEASNDGQIRRATAAQGTRIGRTRKLAKHPSGYIRVTLQKNGCGVGCWVHRLVAAAFFGYCPEGLEVHHKDADRTNNDIENLEYVTQMENVKDKMHRRFAKLAIDVQRWRERNRA